MTPLRRWTRRVLAGLVALVGVVALIGAVWFANGGKIQADVVHKECHPLGGSFVTIETRWFAIQRSRDVAYAECQSIPPQAFVEYYLRSGRTVIYVTEGGDCIWDTSSIGPC